MRNKKVGPKQRAVEALRKIAAAHGGSLRAPDVVEAARPASHPLHGRFEWDDTKAAHQHRLWQARHLIRMVFEVVEGTETEAPVFYSLTTDRAAETYRPLATILTDDDLYVQLLADAVAELKAMQARYRMLKELRPVFLAANRIDKKLRGTKGRGPTDRPRASP